MTSNIGSQAIVELAAAGASHDEIEKQTRTELKKFFRPELLNRIDEVILFHQLEKEQLRGIVDIQLRGLSQRLVDRRIQLELSAKAKDRLAEEGYDPTFGARPLKRVIQQRIENPLATKLLAGEFAADDTVEVDVADGSFSFEKEK